MLPSADVMLSHFILLHLNAIHMQIANNNWVYKVGLLLFRRMYNIPFSSMIQFQFLHRRGEGCYEIWKGRSEE